MSKYLVLSITILTVLAAPSARAQDGTSKRFTFAQAIETALDNGLDIRAADQAISASASRVSGAGEQRYPRLRAEGNVLYWNKPLVVSLAPSMPGMLPGPGLVVRDQTTAQVSVSLVQPISGLFVLNRLVALERNGFEAARADKARAALDTAQRTSEAYLRLLQAKAQLAIAEQSVRQVEAQLERSRILEKGGLLGSVDVLRLTSARDSARQSMLRARTNVEVAEAALVLALNLASGTKVEVVDDFPDPPPAPTFGEANAKMMASAQRPEILAARERVAQAQAGSSVAKAQLLPNINGIVTYQHVEGQGPFQPKNAWFAGAMLSWDIWDWGKNWNGVKEAQAKANQAAIGARSLQDQILFDVERRVREARTAFETIAVAKSALQAAEEAYRIQSVRYAQGGATTTDLLDAETDVSRARSGYSATRYEYFLAQASLARAVGRLPSAQLGEINANR